MNANLDDQFESYGLAAMIGNAVSPALKQPKNIAVSIGGLAVVGIVFSNALFFQNGTHPAAIFETRLHENNALSVDELAKPVLDAANEKSRPLTRIVLNDQSATQPLPQAVDVQERPTVEASTPIEPSEQTATNEKSDLLELQQRLSELGFYEGEVDGLMGPKTQAAIEAYKAHVGLRGIELTPAELALSAKNNQIVTAAIPKVRPQTPDALPQRRVETVRYTPPAPQETSQSINQQPSRDEEVAKIQAGLRAFGNETISVDGQLGPQTVAAIKEFQKLFKLEPNGEVNAQLVKKMRDVGLIN